MIVFISQSGKEVDGFSCVLVVRTQECCGVGQQHMNLAFWLPVSKVSFHFNYKKKAEQTERSTALLRPIRKVMSQGKVFPTAPPPPQIRETSE